jgi:hypothetical protein
MNGFMDADRFQGELAGWAGRGFLCAVPSLVFAVVGGFQQPAELVAMAVGFAAYVVLFAGFCSAHAMQRTDTRQRFVRTLKMSAWLKASLLVGVIVAWLLALIPRFPTGGLFLGVGVTPDLWLGMAATSVVGWLAGVHDVLLIGDLNSFPWTLLTTVLQGALVSGLLFALAGGIFGCGRLWTRFGWKPITPARSAG